MARASTPLTHALRELSRLAQEVADMMERPQDTLPGVGEWIRCDSTPGWRCPILGVSRRTIYRLVGEGKIRKRKRDGMVWYNAQDAATAHDSQP